MLEEFLVQVGIFRFREPIAQPELLDRFSDWLNSQEIREEGFWFLVSRVGAFICEYLIEGRSAQRYIDGRRILLRLPVDSSHGVYREFDPYAVAIDLIRNRKPLKGFLLSF